MSKGRGRRKPAPWEWGMTVSTPEITQAGLFEDYKNMFSAWCMSRFKWTLPHGCSQRFLEQTLFYTGIVAFYRDPRYDKYMLAKCTPLGPANVQDEFTAVRTVSSPGYEGIELDCYLGHEDRPANDWECVLIFCSDMRIPDIAKVKRVSKMLSELDISIQLASKALRNSRIAIIGQDQELTYKNLFRKLDEGIPFLTASSTIDPNAITSLDIGGNPQSLKALREERNQYWNQSMIMLGISSANQDKKERLVEDEVSSNNEHSMLARIAVMHSRERAVELINEAFPDAGVSVEWAVEAGMLESDEKRAESLSSEDSIEKNGEEVQ